MCERAAMPDYILIDGDKAMFLPSFGMAIVVVQPGTLSASGTATRGGKKLCVDGDEANVSVPGCTYMAGPYTIPGTGTLKIDALGADQVAKKTQTGGTKVLLVGSTFTAKFEVQSPAQMVTPSGATTPDSTPSYTGSGSFVTTNTKFRGS
jgi:hypothetical protein